MAENDIYNSQARYNYIKNNLELFGIKPEDRKDKASVLSDYKVLSTTTKYAIDREGKILWTIFIIFLIFNITWIYYYKTIMKEKK